MKVTGFNHLTLCIKSLEKSLPFYCDILGMTLVHRGNTDAYLEWGDAWICLLEKSDYQKTENQIGMDHIAFSISEEGFNDAITVLHNHHIPITRTPIERGGGHSVQFLDPDGITIELFTGSLQQRMRNWK
ncbi:VOC family protein [Thermoflavimicrobium daqui]|uniref:Glutathione transferase n=1 Tax=Thermoflavimicrobium daqui TaxID=2137476 RepID=A0A364K9T1_9BACL|nr:VOC family protein [Thermoflavimicrobium daqui]RAL26982.1 glutathione transferase [Thermoflavimicrobium daqui]